MELIEDVESNNLILRITLTDRYVLTAAYATDIDDHNNLHVTRKFFTGPPDAHGVSPHHFCNRVFRNWIEWQDVTDQVKRGEFHDPDQDRTDASQAGPSSSR